MSTARDLQPKSLGFVAQRLSDPVSFCGVDGETAARRTLIDGF